MSIFELGECAGTDIEQRRRRSAEPRIEAALQHDVPGFTLVDSNNEPSDVDRLFDGLAGLAGTAEQRHYLNFFEIVAAPGDLFEGPARPGDILLERRMDAAEMLVTEAANRGGAIEADDAGAIEPCECRGAGDNTQDRCKCGCKQQTHSGACLRNKRDSELGLPYADEDDDPWEAAPPSPVAVPEADPVPFAPDPPEGGFWPFATSHPRGREVNYRAVDGASVGSRTGRQFLARRDGGGRYHVGVDLFANFDDPVIAIEGGRIVNFYPFCCKQTKTTYALLVEHSNVVVNYGEVSPDSLSRNGLGVGSRVVAGQVIGFVGRNPAGSSMMHLEAYELGIRKNLHWYPHKQRPDGLLNPTRYLLSLQDHGRTADRHSIRPTEPSEPSAPTSSLWSRIGFAASAVKNALSNGLWSAAVRITDEVDLTNLVFLERHPEREGRRLSKAEPDYKSLSREWLDIRDEIVRPALEETSTDSNESASYLLDEEAASAASAFVRWVQQSLSRILGLSLATDGVAGTKTRQAIKQFQTQKGLAPDGVVGTRTQQAIRDALRQIESGAGPTQTAPAPSGGPAATLPQCTGIGRPEILDRFEFGKEALPPQHRAVINKIAECVVASLATSSPIRNVNLTGHTDPVGSELDNFQLGLRRAQTVKRELEAAIDRLSASASKGVVINPLSEGEKRPRAGPALSRRVEVVMFIRAAPAVRERRKVTALSAAERTALADAINELRRRGVYQNFVRDHANSMSNAHRQPAFLPWHRQFILNFETELRAISSSITLPHWDWSNDPGVDSSGNPSWNPAMVALMGGNGTGTDSVVSSGPFAGWTAFDSAGAATSLPLQRTFATTSWATTLPTAADVAAAMAVTPYDESPWDDGSTTGGFRNNLEGWFGINSHHNVVHGWVGGSMLPGTSPNDPCFFLHHCFVDKIWADWQAANPGMDYVPATTQARPGSSPAHGRDADVPVFDVTGASPVTFKPSESLDMNKLKDHKGNTGIRVRYL